MNNIMEIYPKNIHIIVIFKYLVCLDIELLEMIKKTSMKLIQSFVDAGILPLSPVFFVSSLIQGEVYLDLLVKAK